MILSKATETNRVSASGPYSPSALKIGFKVRRGDGDICSLLNA